MDYAIEQTLTTTETAVTMDTYGGKSIILFDGVCNLCNGFVRFVIRRDPEQYFVFCPLQSPTGTSLLNHHDLQNLNLSSLVLIENQQVYTRSTAALRIARKLSMPWPLLYGLIALPRPLRDAIYGFIGQRRYNWFGKTEQCSIPDKAQQHRFL